MEDPSSISRTDELLALLNRQAGGKGRGQQPGGQGSSAQSQNAAAGTRGRAIASYSTGEQVPAVSPLSIVLGEAGDGQDAGQARPKLRSVSIFTAAAAGTLAADE